MKPVPVVARAARMIFKRDDVTPAQQAAFVYLATCCKTLDEEPNCFPSVAALAAALNVVERSARRILREIEGRGLVRTEHGAGGDARGGKTSRYYLIGLTPGHLSPGVDDDGNEQILSGGHQSPGVNGDSGLKPPFSRIEASHHPRTPESPGHLSPPDKKCHNPRTPMSPVTIEGTIEKERKKSIPPLPPQKPKTVDLFAAPPPALLSNAVVVEAWNAMAKEAGLATVAKVDGRRASDLGRLMKRLPLPQILDAIATLGALPASAFVRGGGRDGWRATFDWFVRPPDRNGGNGAVRLLEGQFAASEPMSNFDRTRASIDRDMDAWRDELTPTMEALP